MKVKYSVIPILAILVFSAPAFAQLGIFDKTADWGDNNSPPQRGTYKAAGSVTVANSIYTMMGNGDDIWDNNDEGFFVYSEKSGDWRLSAHVSWLDPGSNEWSKIGVMIREKGADAGSRHYWTALRGAAYGDRVDAQWRTIANSSSGNAQIFEDPPTNSVAVAADNEGIWLRVTRISSIGMLFSEWSTDGKNWNLSHSTTVTGWADTVAYGLAITSHVDDDYLVEAQVDNVKLEQAPAVTDIKRSISPGTFKSGQTLAATLDLFYTGSTATTLLITETPPPGFTISDVSDGGTASNGVITWNYNLKPGSSKVTYKVTAPSNYDPKTSGYSAVWKGTGGTFTISGQTSAYYFNFVVGDKIFSFDFSAASQFNSWEYLAGFWDIQDGLYYEFDDADGPLVTLTGDAALSDYSISVDAMGLVADADWGIVFRATDLSNFYSWQFCNGYLMFVSYVGGTRTEKNVLAYAESLNVWQKFQVIAKGNVFYLLYDGDILSAIENDSLPAGQVGFFGWINSGTAIPENKGGIAYDNLVVSSVSEATNVNEWSLY